jgi:predicted nucleic acid-binding protein/GNAT superfamily N-acetyltransferase
MRIVTINENSSFLEEVIELGNVHSSTLGFLPRGAYASHAAKGHILAAIDKSNEVLGYLLYNVNQKGRFVYISHLCVSNSYRRGGVGRALVDTLKQNTKDLYRGIRVRCRRDWEASKVWPKYNFIAKNEIPGRSKEGSRLTVWWFDHGHPDLLQLANKRRLESKVKIVIDANVFYDLRDKQSDAKKESVALLADWLQENIELCVTQEIFNEINRNSDALERQKTRSFAETFVTVSSTDSKFQKVKQVLRKSFFPYNLSESDASDLRQLARTIAADVKFFVTRDGPLLEQAEDIYERFGTRIMRPSDIIIQQDSLMRESEYQPVRLAGSLVEITRVQPEQHNFLQRNFRAPQEETKGKFRDTLHQCLADPHAFQTEIIQGKDKPLALIVYNRQNGHSLEIPLLRLYRGPLAPTLARYLIVRAIITSSKENRMITKITDEYLDDSLLDALQENGFLTHENIWMKANLPLAQTASEITANLQKLGESFPESEYYFCQLSNLLHASAAKESSQALLRVEKALWPTKVTNLDIPTFVVPIWPYWAMNLFDSNLGKQHLFGSQPYLIFNIENVYYRSKHPRILEAPARILWYVSKGKGKYQNVQSIRACSYLDEVIIDKPKTLYSRFRRLGIYEWEQVFNIAKNDLEQEIMAFRFSNTELFDNPIELSKLRRIWIEETENNFHLQAPIAISKKLFFRLYKLGMNIA